MKREIFGLGIIKLVQMRAPCGVAFHDPLQPETKPAAAGEGRRHEMSKPPRRRNTALREATAKGETGRRRGCVARVVGETGWSPATRTRRDAREFE